MRLERRRAVYGTTIGAGTFIVGVILVWITTPVENVSGLPAWRASLRVYLEAHGVVLNLTGVEPTIPALRVNWAFPLVLVAFGTVLTMSGVSGTYRPKYLLENGSTILYGYLGIGLVGLVESGARPAVAGIVFLMLLLTVAMYVGGSLVQTVTGGLPFIGIASLGLVAILGLLFVLAGLAVITAMLPMIVVSVAGMLVGIVLYWSVRNAPR